MKLSTTNARNLQDKADPVSAEAMANEAIRIAETLMWAVYGSDEAARGCAVAGVLHTELLDRLAS
ncbi:MAG: hypothetical protein ACXVRK_08270 [Gaiellaceae bacterium]